MTVEELLTVLRTAYLNDRSDRTSGSSDYLWTDTTLALYLNEAQRRFATRALLLRDGSTDAVTLVTLVEGQTIYTLHKSVFAVISAKMETAAADLLRVGHSLLNAYRPATETPWVDPASIPTSSGEPRAYSTDEELSVESCDKSGQLRLRVYPAPSAAVAGQQIRLRVCRKPLYPLKADDGSRSPEIPEDHHLEMLDWAAYLALRIEDDDAGAPKRALDFKASFEQHVQEARNLSMRKLFAPQPWGFGRGGFSWEH